MSIMFRHALENHIQQLTEELQKPSSQDRKADIAHIDALLKSNQDGRFRRALLNARQRLESEITSRDTAELRIRLDALRKIFLEIKDRPEYAARRRRGSKGLGRPRRRPATTD